MARRRGTAYLDGGVWNGRRIVDSSWVRESTRPQIHISEKTTGLSAEDFGNSYGGGGADGYAWHLGDNQYSATGNGGQILIVVPEHELAVVFTGANFRQGWIWTRRETLSLDVKSSRQSLNLRDVLFDV
jgi:CubicO group peptidase (beta-lactamase class C family)